MRRVPKLTKAASNATSEKWCHCSHQRIAVWADRLDHVLAQFTFQNFTSMSSRYSAKVRHSTLLTVLCAVFSESAFANTTSLPPPPPPPPSEPSKPPLPDSPNNQASTTTSSNTASATTQTDTSTNSNRTQTSEQSNSTGESPIADSRVESKSTSTRLKNKLPAHHRSFGLFAVGKLGGAYRTLAQPVTSEPINIDPGHFMIAGFQLAWIPQMSRSQKMLIRIGLDYHSSLNLKLEEQYPDGNSSSKPIRHQWLALSMAWMARRNKKKVTFAIGPAIHYEIRMVYSEVKLVIPNYRVHVPTISLPLLFSDAKEKVRFEISPQFALPLRDRKLDDHLQPAMRMTVGGEAILFVRLFRRLGMTLNYRETFAFIGSNDYFDHSLRMFSLGLAYDDSKLRSNPNSN